MLTVLKYLFGLAVGIASTLFGGFVLSKFWAWFINPKFASAPRLGYLDCVGLMLFVAFFTMNLSEASGPAKEGEGEDDFVDDSLRKSATMIFCGYPVLLLSGYVWHYFIG